MKQEDFENTYWHLKGVGAGKRHKDNGKTIPVVLTAPKGANECWMEGFRDAYELY